MRLNGDSEQSLRRVGDLSLEEFDARLGRAGLGIRIGPFDAFLQSDVHAIAGPLHRLYRDHALLEGERVFSFHLRLHLIRSLRHRLQTRVRLTVDGRAPHEDHPAAHALAVFEWGMNLVIALRHHRLFMLHAAVLEKSGGALIMPASPGGGKTTLCAALAMRGWRLLSDEFGLVEPGTAQLLPLPRPMPLKNESIGVVRAFAEEAELGPEIAGTRKGTIAHVKPPKASVEQSAVAAPAKWLVFPTWRDGAALELERIQAVDAFMRIATNAFNYEMLGEPAFAAVTALTESTAGYSLTYSKLEDAVRVLDELTAADEG